MLNRLILALCTLLLPILAWGEETIYDPLAIYLTWQRDPAHTMIVQWISEDQIPPNTIYYKTLNSEDWKTAKAAQATIPSVYHYDVHRVELVDLFPNTIYQFKISKKGKIFKFQTMPEKLEAPIRFVVGGDIYHDGIRAVSETNQQAAKTSPHFALVGGDLAYAADRISLFSEKMQSWMDWVLSSLDVKTEKRLRWIEWLISWKNDMMTPEGIMIPMIPAIGNHDVNGGYAKTAKDAAYFHLLFAFPGKQGFNVLNFNNYLSIIVLDTGHTNSIGGKQTHWLYHTLREHHTATHKFALYHVPAYPSFRNYSNKHSSAVRHYWVPLFDYYSIQAAFENHDHAYKRTFPLRSGKIDPKGMLFLGDGAWGIEIPRVPKTTAERWYLEKTSPSRHFILVTLEGEKRHYTAIDYKGNIIDTAEN